MSRDTNALPHGASSPHTPPLVALWARLRAQPAKAAVTGVLVCVLLVLVIRSFSGPKTVLAAPGSRAAPAAAARLLNLPAESIPNLPVPPTGLDPASRRAAVVPQALARDIFAIDLRRVAKAGEARTDDAGAAEPEPAKSPEVQREERKRELAAIRLEGTITGPTSVAFLDGILVHEGDSHRGWQVRQILDQRVVLECDGVRQELRMPE